ncbi:MAG: AEC family transporter, partial [Leptospira sp.]|nr:AEC family transporter [Leptospira sp.]
HIHSIDFTGELIYAALMPWIVFFLAFIIFWSLFLLGYISRKIAGVLILTAGLGNTSFVGLPLIQAYFGSEYLGVGIIADQLGTFLCLGTVGVVFAFYAKEGIFRFKEMGKMIFLFPPSIALILAVLLRPFEYPIWLSEILLRLGDTLTPLALFSVGMQLSLREAKGRKIILSIALVYKLIFAPIFIYILYKIVIGLEGTSTNVIVFEAGMAPMVTSSIIAIENDLEPELAALILGSGILLSFLTTYLLFNLL